MATITVRDLDEMTRDKLRVRAAANGRSMEAEVREILADAVAAQPSPGSGLGTRIRSMFADVEYADYLAEYIPPRTGEWNPPESLDEAARRRHDAPS